MKRLPDIYYTEHAVKLEEMRAVALGKKERIVYLCRNAKTDGAKVYCAKGYPLRGKKGQTASFLSVLKGLLPRVCSACTEYDDEE